MFDIEKEVEAWSQAVHAGRCRTSASVAELTDHLYCEIDRARAQGLSDEMAFAAAVAKLGQTQELNAEHAKNRSLLAAGCAAVAKYESRGTRAEHRGPLLGHALIWAALMLATSLMMSKSRTPDELSMLLLGIMVPFWWCSDQILRWALHQKPRGGGR